MRKAAAACVVVVLAACSGDSGSFPALLTPADVQGVYRVCTLRFTPVQTAIPSVDLLASVIDTDPAGCVRGAATFSKSAKSIVYDEAEESASPSPSVSPEESASPAATPIPTYKSPDGSVELILREDPKDEDERPQEHRHGASCTDGLDHHG